MSGSNFPVQKAGPTRLRIQAIRIAGFLRGWASTETGGWTIICGLAGVTAIALGFLLVAPRADQTSDAPDASPAVATIKAAVDELTLAPDALQDLSHAQARVWNEGLPFSTDPIRPARPLIAPTTDIEAYGRALDCLTTAVYYEAASETPLGQAAVAQVVLNRVRHPAYPRSVCGVVFQGSQRATGCQFSFTCDGAMGRVPSPAGWARARAVASAALNGTVVAGVGTATHYHTDWVAPYWATRLSKITRIGTHIFYRWSGAWGLPTAFTADYAGSEPVEPGMLGLAMLEASSPAEVIAMPVLTPIADSPSGPALARLPIPGEIEAVSQAAAPQDETLTTPDPLQTAPVTQRDVPILRDPLANPAQPPRQRQRIAAPSNW